MPQPKASPLNGLIGQHVRQIRWLRGMSQQQLAEAVGVRFQQIQKYESGVNRIAASRLWEIAQVLQTPIESFFSEMPKRENGAADMPEEAARLFKRYTEMPEEKRALLGKIARVMSVGD